MAIILEQRDIRAYLSSGRRLTDAQWPHRSVDTHEWYKLIVHEPLIALELFKKASLLNSSQHSDDNFADALQALGVVNLKFILSKLVKEPNKQPIPIGLHEAIADSLLAAYLVKQWFKLKQIPWSPNDYWTVLFHDIAEWNGWLMDESVMWRIKKRAGNKNEYAQMFADAFGMSKADMQLELVEHHQLPESCQFLTSPKDRTGSFKASALKFFLPFGHDLARELRKSWSSKNLEKLCRSGKISLGIADFQKQLKSWVAEAARSTPNPFVATAARQLLADQPSKMDTSKDYGFSEDDFARALSLSNNRACEPITNNASYPVETNPDQPKMTQPKGQFALDTQLIEEVQREFQFGKAWHSASEIQEAALYALKDGFKFKRIMFLDFDNGFWKPFTSVGCKKSPLLRHLKFAKAGSVIIEELSQKATSIWINEHNRHLAESRLPPPLVMGTSDHDFILRSFTIEGDVTMMLYCDSHERENRFSQHDYTLLKTFCRHWNASLTAIRL